MSYQRIAFIAGCGYSGSTLLDMMLGALDKVVAVGEVKKLAEHFSQVGGSGNCCCGTPLNRCEFWERVRREMASRVGNEEFTFANYPLRVPEPNAVGPGSIHRFIPSQTELALLLGNRTLWRLVQRWNRRARFHGETTANMLTVFDAVAQVHGASVIADSSKAPLSIKLLQMADPERLRIVYLVRDGRGVALSAMKRKKYSYEDSVRWWVRTNRNVQAMMATIPRRHVHRIRYEDLCVQPDETMRQLCAFLGIDKTVDYSSFELKKERYHMIAGNPMRMKREENKVRVDEKWRTELGEQEFSTFARYGETMNQFFGYEPTST